MFSEKPKFQFALSNFTSRVLDDAEHSVTYSIWLQARFQYISSNAHCYHDGVDTIEWLSMMSRCYDIDLYRFLTSSPVHQTTL